MLWVWGKNVIIGEQNSCWKGNTMQRALGLMSRRGKNRHYLVKKKLPPSFLTAIGKNAPPPCNLVLVKSPPSEWEWSAIFYSPIKNCKGGRKGGSQLIPEEVPPLNGNMWSVSFTEQQFYCVAFFKLQGQPSGRSKEEGAAIGNRNRPPTPKMCQREEENLLSLRCFMPSLHNRYAIQNGAHYAELNKFTQMDQLLHDIRSYHASPQSISKR